MLLFLFCMLVLIALAVWAIPQVMTAIGVPPNVATIIYVGMVCLIVIWVISIILGYSPLPFAAPVLRR